MLICPTCSRKYGEGVLACEADGTRLIPEELFAGSSEVPVGTIVKEYRVEAKIGEGGFGAVYRAVHPVIGKRAAVKVLSMEYSTNPEMVSRFISEASVVNEIRHRNIIDIFDFGKLPDGRQFFLMELLDGRPLDKILAEKGAFTFDEMLPIIRGVVRALEAAHARGIAHRDLKPENIFISYDEDGKAHPKLLDFGIAKLLGTGSGGSKTRTGTPMGTPLYMSPEQCRGVNVDQRTDIYSLGAMIHELLTGKPPFDGETMMDILLKQTSAAPPPMSSVNPNVPAALDAPVLRMLEKNADARPQTPAAALEELLRAADPAAKDWSASTLPGDAPRATFSGAGGADLGRAKTVAAVTPRPSTMSGTSLPQSDGGSKKGVLVPLLLSGALAAGFAIWFFAVRTPVAVKADSAAPKPTNGTSAATSAAVSVTPSATATTPTVKPDVEVMLRTTPAGVDVFLDKKKVGVSDAPIVLARNAGPYVLTLKKNGFKSTEVTIDERQHLSSAESISLSIALEKQKASKGTGLSTDIPTGYP